SGMRGQCTGTNRCVTIRIAIEKRAITNSRVMGRGGIDKKSGRANRSVAIAALICEQCGYSDSGVAAAAAVATWSWSGVAKERGGPLGGVVSAAGVVVERAFTRSGVESTRHIPEKRVESKSGVE